MFGIAGRRLAESVVALFAVLGFAFVPLGRKTALEHSRDILTTPAAVNAFRELGGAILRLRGRLVDLVTTPGRAGDRRPPGPEPTRGNEPKATLPRLGQTPSDSKH